MCFFFNGIWSNLTIKMRENNECKQYAMDAIKINLNYRIVTYNLFRSLYIGNNNITINNNNNLYNFIKNYSLIFRSQN